MGSKDSLREKVKGLYNRISEDFYLSRSDLEVNGEKYNSALLLGTLSELNKGNMLLFGEYGGGKTTSAEYLNAIFNGLPLDLVKRVAIRGNPQLTEEKIIGRPDYGKLHQGEEDVVWQNFVSIGPKIFDEFNRVPETNQSIVLNGVDRGEWNYLNDFVSTGSQPFFATCNYADRGNNSLIPPILDRFDVAAESKFPGFANALAIAKEYNNNHDEVLKNPNLTKEVLGLLSSRKPYDKLQKELEELVSQHNEYLSAEGFSVLSSTEKEKIEQQIKEIPFNSQAEQYFGMLIAEMNTSPKYGQKRSVDNPLADSENGLYLNSMFLGSGSRRLEKSLWRYCQSLAWLQDSREQEFTKLGKPRERKNKDPILTKIPVVNLDHVLAIAPYVLWHRVNWTKEIEQKFSQDLRKDPLGLYITKTLLSDGTGEVPGVRKRFLENQTNLQRVFNLVGYQKFDDAINEAERFYNDGKGHPIFQDIIFDLEGD